MNSWHAQVVKNTTNYFENTSIRKKVYLPDGDYTYQHEPVVFDICNYTRAFIAGVLKVMAIGSFLGYVTICIIAAFVEMFKNFFIYHGEFKYGILALFGIVFLIVAGFFAVVGIIAISVETTIKYKNKYNAIKVKKEPEMLKTMYRHWKEKTCVKLDMQ
jgi:hypothetical protein